MFDTPSRFLFLLALSIKEQTMEESLNKLEELVWKKEEVGFVMGSLAFSELKPFWEPAIKSEPDSCVHDFNSLIGIISEK